LLTSTDIEEAILELVVMHTWLCRFPPTVELVYAWELEVSRFVRDFGQPGLREAERFYSGMVPPFSLRPSQARDEGDSGDDHRAAVRPVHGNDDGEHRAGNQRGELSRGT